MKIKRFRKHTQFPDCDSPYASECLPEPSVTGFENIEVEVTSKTSSQAERLGVPLTSTLREALHAFRHPPPDPNLIEIYVDNFIAPFSITISRHKTIRDVMTAIEEQEGLPVEHQTLSYFNRKPIDGEEKINTFSGEQTGRIKTTTVSFLLELSPEIEREYSLRIERNRKRRGQNRAERMEEHKMRTFF
ncbi:hypothetical protein BJ508DRAFT_331379 [Ascobolus immersus RN42]|uniref:Ubiquitin-like domain-containing protein n=1 Tax=Ascobolus immersus RN42 TaxID=1160509 RepID=A0A3N4HR75_ASCIM|nr:hypothetical protein BJ508DRAFT_331379 [Ascobolus immersus RN42]